jgi:hypothetical protein
MTRPPKQLTLTEWDRRYDQLRDAGFREPRFGGRLSRHLEEGDFRLQNLLFDNSPEALGLWNFLLTEEERLVRARQSGKKLVGAMKDLGTVPVLAYAFDSLVAFYPDGAWWIPCVMEMSAGLLDVADTLGVGDSFCPVRAMLGAFVTEAHFPLPDLLVCSAGAVCDDFSAIAQRLEGLGHAIAWWEIPHRRAVSPEDAAVSLPGGFRAPRHQIRFVTGELERVKGILEGLAGELLGDETLARGIASANAVRLAMAALRAKVYTAPRAPLPALEMLIAEMLAIHYCSDQDETLAVLTALLCRVDKRISRDEGYFGEEAVRVFWVNPVADLRVMNLLEECGGRIAGTEYLFSHALDIIPQNVPPMEALARMALADPMVGSAHDRALRIGLDIEKFGAEAVIISRIPGASHCATEGVIIGEAVRERLGVPVLEIEVPPLSDAYRTPLRTRIEALIETVRQNRGVDSAARRKDYV